MNYGSVFKEKLLSLRPIRQVAQMVLGPQSIGTGASSLKVCSESQTTFSKRSAHILPLQSRMSLALLVNGKVIIIHLEFS